MQKIAQIRSNQTITYHKSKGSGKKDLTDAQKSGLEKGKNGDYNGEMSAETKRSVKRMIDTFCNQVLTMRQKLIKCFGSSKINLTFVTLTLPSEQVHTDLEIKRELLEHFIIICKRKFKHFEYFWRAEKQKNGSIHFHLLTNYYMPHQWLRNSWNKVCNKLGYVDQYSKKMAAMSFKEYYSRFGQYSKKSYLEIRQYFEKEKKSGWNNPNSTDIHAVGKVKNITAYVIKYISKDGTKSKGYDKLSAEEKAKLKVDGRIWGASDSLRTLKTFELVIFEKESQNLSQIYENRTKFEEVISQMIPESMYTSKWFEIIEMNVNYVEIMQNWKNTAMRFMVEFYEKEIFFRYFGKNNAIYSLMTAKGLPFPDILF